jgi:hypothetical protein
MADDAGSYVYEVRFKNAPLRESRSAEEYVAFLRELVPNSEASIADLYPKSFDLDDPAAAQRELQTLVSGVSATDIPAIIFELSGAGYHEFDDLASVLHGLLNAARHNNPAWIVFVISANDEADLRRSVFLSHLVKDVLGPHAINLLIQFNSLGSSPFLLTPDTRLNKTALPVLDPPAVRAREKAQPIVITSEQMLQNARILFGHFDASTSLHNFPYHIPAVVSWEHLATDQAIIAQLKNDLEIIVDGPFEILHAPLLQANGSEVISATVRTALSNISRLSESQKGPYVIVTDLLATGDQLEPYLRDLQAKSASVAGIFSLASYQGVRPSSGAPFRSYLELPYGASRIPGHCFVCDFDKHPVRLTNLPEIKAMLGAFDSITFWELIGSDKDFYSAGHEAMPRTGYHYYFRLIVRALFKHHAYGLAIRIRNALRKAQIYPKWVQKILCPDDDEIRVFAQTVAEVLDLASSDVVFFPRDLLRFVTGTRMDPSLIKQIPQSISGALSGQNVIIIDQAAHHFRTVASLASICEYYRSIVLAFAVVIDRVDPAVKLAERVPFSHYVPLYSWPYPPSRPNECACQQ